MKEKREKHRRTITTIIFMITTIFCILSILFIILLVKTNEKEFLKDYKNNQQLLVDMTAGDIKKEIDEKSINNDDDLKIMNNVLKNMYTSGSRYWIAARDTKVVFIKNENITQEYNNSELSSVLNTEDIVSLKNFESKGHTYSIIMTTDMPYALAAGGIDRLNIYLYLYTIVALIIYLVSITVLSIRIDNMSMNIAENIVQIKVKNRMIEALSAASLINDHNHHVSYREKDCYVDKHSERSNSYRFKFYINASHSIYINGSRGEKHPHTWEITMVVSQNENGNMFIRFNKIEEVIEKFFSRYQDIYINDLEPFDKVNPTLENLSRYFNKELSFVIKKIGWNLEKIEMSETPTRSYIINNCDPNVNIL